MGDHHRGRDKDSRDQHMKEEYDDSFQDQRSPQHGMGNRPRHWQGSGSGEQGRFAEEPAFDRRSYATGNQFGEAGSYGRQQRYDGNRDPDHSPDYDHRSDFGRGNERTRDERDSGQRRPGVHATDRNEPLRSRSADPGQSSYGGFKDEDPRFQRQQFEHYQGGRGYPGSHQSAQGGQQVGQRAERQQSAYRQERILPKGYSRSDERLHEDICERLGHSGLDVREVSIQVSEGHVTLEGSVKERRSKHAIEDCVDECFGVKDIDNRIRVQRDGSAGGSALGE